jgi:hypothetical protein
LDKLPLRGQARSPLKYSNCGVCSCVGRSVWEEVCPLGTNFCPPGLTLGAKTCGHVGILEGVVLWLMDSVVKSECINFCTLPIKLVESFNLSTDGHSVKASLILIIKSAVPHPNNVILVIERKRQYLIGLRGLTDELMIFPAPCEEIYNGSASVNKSRMSQILYRTFFATELAAK